MAYQPMTLSDDVLKASKKKFCIQCNCNVREVHCDQPEYESADYCEACMIFVVKEPKQDRRTITDTHPWGA
jgi:hypothetical protein